MLRGNVAAKAAPGPPPRPGLVWNEVTHRWRNPKTGEEVEHPKRQAKPSRVPQQKPSEKALRAKASHTLVDKDIQRYAEERNEPAFAKSVGGLSFKDNEPVDVVLGKGGVISHGVELKTVVTNRAGKITMKRSAMERKASWEKNNKATFHTVVLDDTLVKDANGHGEHDDSKRVMYYKRGAGSFRISSMQKVKDIAELKKLIATPDDKLPPSAAPSPQWSEMKAGAA